MENVFISTDRTEMRFPVDYITRSDVVKAIGNEKTIRFMDSVESMTYTQQDALGFISFLEYTRKSDSYLELGIFLKNTQQFIGMCTLENIDESKAELGFWLSIDYVGKGIMRECATELINYAKDIMKLKTLEAYVIVEYKKSKALLERLGFINKEILKNNTKNKGIKADRYRYELDL